MVSGIINRISIIVYVADAMAMNLDVEVSVYLRIVLQIMVIGILEQNTPDNLWWNRARIQYALVGGDIQYELRCGSFYLELVTAASSGFWNVGAKYTPDAFWFKQPWGYSNFYTWAGGSVFRGAGTEGCWNLNMMMARDASWSRIWEIGDHQIGCGFIMVLVSIIFWSKELLKIISKQDHAI